jgi:energy-coupling factor transporter transmembrane protein EcfT
MTADASDISDDLSPPVTTTIANELISEQVTRRWFRTIALVAALLTLVVLLGTMIAIVQTFVSEFRVLALDTQVQLAAAQRVAVPPSAAASTAAAVVPATTHVWVSLGAFTTSIAALVTALVVAATVLAIALVRASFTLTTRGDDPAQSTADTDEDAPVTLPAAEFVKAFGESVQTALKGLQSPVR